MFRTCRTSIVYALFRGSWQDFNLHDASRGPSAIAELLVETYLTMQCADPVDAVPLKQKRNKSKLTRKHGLCTSVFGMETPVISSGLFIVAHCRERIRSGPTGCVNVLSFFTMGRAMPPLYKNCPFSGLRVFVALRQLDLHNTWFLGPTRVQTLNGTLIVSCVLVKLPVES